MIIVLGDHVSAVFYTKSEEIPYPRLGKRLSYREPGFEDQPELRPRETLLNLRNRENRQKDLFKDLYFIGKRFDTGR